ncbi:hypothetical protein RIF29_41963 [Crotalaria pallida]|uniref:Uncharacterized protein n=1 Tax=Crotalaria pallida TaxID=3830 RepID=A0AAN9E6P1_CROPI
MIPPRRKKWTEAEEKTLIDKYGEMVSDGSLAKMRTREKKFRPVACHVNSLHHLRDPVAYPWHWTWKDVSTKVQNMRHQYLLVKQKIKKPETDCVGVGVGVDGDGDGSGEFDWVEGLTHWSNFLRYKDVFGDVALGVNGNGGNDLMVMNRDGGDGDGFLDGGGGGGGMDMVEFGGMGNSGDGDGDFGVENEGVMGLGFEYDGEDGEVNYNGNGKMREDGDVAVAVENGYVYEEGEVMGSSLMKKKRKVGKGVMEKKAWKVIVNQMGQLREMELRFEQREMDRERERQRRESARAELDKQWEKKMEEREKEREELRRKRMSEWEAMEKENEEMERKRREEMLIREREWEERMNCRRLEWKKRVDEMLSQHRVEMGQMQTRILHEQQNLTSQLLSIFSQWTAQPAGLSDHTSASNHYLSHMMQNLHHVNGIVHGDARVEGDNQEDQFIVDG